jgi:hypothetical protein
MNIDKKYIIYDSNTLEHWNDVHKKLSWFSPCPPAILVESRDHRT